MRVALQASDLDHERIDGTRVYLRELLRRFGSLSPETDFLLYHRSRFNPALAPPTFPNYVERLLSFPLAWMQTRFAWAMYRERPDKLFLPIQAAPLFLPQGLEVTATIHDLAFKKYPKTFPREDLFKLNFLLNRVVSRADKLIAVSEATKRDLLDFFPHLPPERIHVIHHGFDGAFFGTKLSPEDLKRELGEHRLEAGNYILYVGALQPRKNLIRLIRAFEGVKREFPGLKCVLAGEDAWLSGGIREAREKSPSREDILLTGRVSFETLRALYQGARAFVFPSLYEGFGLPILEAFASGTPTLVARNSSLAEVAGEGALFCEAEDERDIEEKLGLLLRDETLRASLRERASRELGRFSWEKTAEETLRCILG